MRANEKDIVVWRAVLAGLCASVVGIGLARFAYTPLIPALIAEQWFTPSQAAYLGAANLVGYLAGALLVRPMALRSTARTVLRTMMLVATVSFVACAWPLSFLWFFVWRFASGFAGGALIVLAPVIVLPHVSGSSRGLVSGVIFGGMGLGVVASGTLVPVVLRWGLAETWVGFAALSGLLTVLAWNGWPREPRPAAGAHAPPAARLAAEPALIALFAAFAFNAVGLVPHMLFLVDFIARGLDQGLDVGARYWILFGCGAVAGPILWGTIADRIGYRRTLPLAFLVEAAAVGLIAVSDRTAVLIVSSIVVGGFVPGIASLVLGRISDVVSESDQRQRAFGLATAAFGVGQAIAGYGFSYIFAETGGAHSLLFLTAAGALLIAFALTLYPDKRSAPMRVKA